MSSPSPLLSYLIKALVRGESERGKKVIECKVKGEAEEITSIKAEAVLKLQRGNRGGDAEKVCMSAREKGRGCVQAGGWKRRREKREKGKEKTRLPQHDLQIALSPWRLLSALSSIHSSSPNSSVTI